MKKWFIPLLVLLVVAFVMSGCGTKTPATTTTTATTPAKTTTTTTPAKTTLTPKSGGTMKIIDTVGPANSPRLGSRSRRPVAGHVGQSHAGAAAEL